jgi:hypothetical protein
MLERCFVRSETLSGIHSSWIGPAIEQYAAWLDEHGYRAGTLAARVSLLRQFGTFAQTRGAQQYQELPAYVEPFLEFWFRRRRVRRTSLPPVTRHARIAIEQMLQVVVRGFVGRPRRHAIRDPFIEQAPGLSAYLRHERGLRETTLGGYDEHLRAFAAYLTDIGQRDLRALSTAVVSGFLTDRSEMRIPAKLNARSGDDERRFRASRTLIGAKRRRQRSSDPPYATAASGYGLCCFRSST